MAGTGHLLSRRQHGCSLRPGLLGLAGLVGFTLALTLAGP